MIVFFSSDILSMLFDMTFEMYLELRACLKAKSKEGILS